MNKVAALVTLACCILSRRGYTQDQPKIDWVKRLKELTSQVVPFTAEWKVERTLPPNLKLAKRLEEEALKKGNETPPKVLEHFRKETNTVLNIKLEFPDSKNFRAYARFPEQHTSFYFLAREDGTIKSDAHVSLGYEKSAMETLNELGPGVPALYLNDWFSHILEAEVEQEDDHQVVVCAEFPNLSGHLVVSLRKADMHFTSIQRYRGTWIHADAEMRAQPRFDARLQEEWLVVKDGEDRGMQAPEEFIVRYFSGLPEKHLRKEDRWKRLSIKFPDDGANTDPNKH